MFQNNSVDIQTLLLKVQKTKHPEHQSEINSTQFNQIKNQVHNKIHQLKKPFLVNIMNSVHQLKTYIKSVQQDNLNQQVDADQKHKKNKQIENKYLQIPTHQQKNKIQKKFMTTQCEQKIKSEIFKKKSEKIQIQFDPIEWKLVKNDHLHFEDYEDMIQNYQILFEHTNMDRQNKTELKDNKQFQFSNNQEYEMRNRIFNQLKIENTEHISKESLMRFLIQHKLILILYNIDLKQLSHELKHFETLNNQFMTKKEFNNFMIQTRTYMNYEQQEIFSPKEYCIFQNDQWKILKKAYNQLDIYGKNQILKSKFITLFKNNRSLKNFMYKQCIYFPDIKRYYTFSKIFHQFQYSYLIQKFSWEQFQYFITNFNKDENIETLDVINKKLVIQNAIQGIHIYVIGDDFLTLLKKEFQKMQKYCSYFVDKHNFFSKLTQHPDYAKFSQKRTRSQNYKDIKIQTVSTTIERILKQGDNYLDLDEILEFFSFKGRSIQYQQRYDMKFLQGFNTQKQQQLQIVSSYSQSSTSSRRKTRKNKYYEYKPNKKKRVTIPEEFNLTKSSKQIIRKEKVEALIVESQQKELKELEKKFKAKPVPKNSSQKLYSAMVAKNQHLKEIRKNIPKEQKNYMPLRLLINPNFWQRKKPQQIKPHCNFLNSNSNILNKSTCKSIPKSFKEQLLKDMEYEAEERRRINLQRRKEFYKNRSLSPEIERLSRIQKSQKSRIIRDMIQKPENHQVKSREVPNFQQLHRIEKQKLNRVKSNPTIPIQFHLSSPKKKQKSNNKQQIKRVIRNIEKQLEKVKKQYQNVKIVTTKKYQANCKYIQKKLEEQREKQEEKIRQEIQKAEKRKSFAKYMFKNNKMISTKKILENQTQKKLKNFKRYQQQLQRINDQNIAAMYSRVLERPFLYQINSANNSNKNIKHLNLTSKNVHKKKSKNVIHSSKGENLYYLNEKKNSNKSQQNLKNEQQEQQQDQEQSKEIDNHKIPNQSIKKQNEYQQDQQQQMTPPKLNPFYYQNKKKEQYQGYENQEPQSMSYYDQKNFSF